jgi:hypothetical protein
LRRREQGSASPGAGLQPTWRYRLGGRNIINAPSSARAKADRIVYGEFRDEDPSWRIIHDFATNAFPRAGAAFSDMHIALAQTVAGDDGALEARARQMNEIARQGRYPSGPCVPAMSHAFAAFERQNFAAAIDALKPIAGELERIGGSRAQLDLVEFTLLKAYLGADRLDDARRMLRARGRGSSSRIPVTGLTAVH